MCFCIFMMFLQCCNFSSSLNLTNCYFLIHFVKPWTGMGVRWGGQLGALASPPPPPGIWTFLIRYRIFRYSLLGSRVFNDCHTCADKMLLESLYIQKSIQQQTRLLNEQTSFTLSLIATYLFESRLAPPPPGQISADAHVYRC
jgi:hypothetical protein